MKQNAKLFLLMVGGLAWVAPMAAPGSLDGKEAASASDSDSDLSDLEEDIIEIARPSRTVYGSSHRPGLDAFRSQLSPAAEAQLVSLVEQSPDERDRSIQTMIQGMCAAGMPVQLGPDYAALLTMVCQGFAGEDFDEADFLLKFHDFSIKFLPVIERKLEGECGSRNPVVALQSLLDQGMSLEDATSQQKAILEMLQGRLAWFERVLPEASRVESLSALGCTAELEDFDFAASFFAQSARVMEECAGLIGRGEMALSPESFAWLTGVPSTVSVQKVKPIEEWTLAYVQTIRAQADSVSIVDPHYAKAQGVVRACDALVRSDLPMNESSSNTLSLFYAINEYLRARSSSVVVRRA